MNNSGDKIWFSIELNTTQLTADVEKAKKQMAMLGVAAKDSANSFEKSFKNAGGMVAGYLGTQALGGLIKEIVTVRGEFQQLGVAFKTMLGSKEKANQLMAQMVDTAAKTPFTLQQVAAGAKQLLAFQVAQEDVNGTLIRLGNIASGLGVPLDRLITVYGQVKAKGRLMGDDLRQFTEAGIPIVHELAKAYGVADSEISKMVESGKIGFPAVQKVVENLTNKGGMFFNLMEEQSKTVTGQISNLQDAISKMFNSIGESNEGVINKSIAGAGFLVTHYEAIGKILMTLVATYGAYRTALMVSSLMEARKYSMTAAEIVLNFSKVASLSTMTYAQQAQTVATSEATVAQLRLNLAVMANPYVIAAAAVVGLVAAFVLMADSSTSAERAQQSLTDYNTRATETANALKSKTTDLVSVINSETASTLQQVRAYEELQGKYKGLLDNLDLQAFKTMNATEQQKLLNEAMDKQASATTSADIAAEKRKLADMQAPSSHTVNYSPYGDTNAAADLKALETQKQFIANLERQKRLNDDAAHEAKVLNLPLKERLAYYDTMVDLLKKQRGETEKMAQTDFSKGVIGTLSKLIDDYVGKIKGLQIELPKIGTKAFWEGEQKAAEDELEKIGKTDAAWSGLMAKRNAAIAKLKMWDFDSKDGAKSNEAAKKLAEERVKLNEEISQANLAEQKRSMERTNAIQQEKINLMKDGFDKEHLQLELNRKLRTESIANAIEDELKLLKERAKKKWELTASRNAKGEITDIWAQSPESKQVALPKASSDQFTKQAIDNEAAFQKAKIDLLDKYTGVYSEYAKKRLDIDKTFYKASQDAEEMFKLTGDKTAFKSNMEAATNNQKKAMQDLKKEVLSSETSGKGLMELFIFGDKSTFITERLKQIIPDFTEFAKLSKDQLEKVNKEFLNFSFTPEQIKMFEQAGIDVEKLRKAIQGAGKEVSTLTDKEKWDRIIASTDKVSQSFSDLGQALEGFGGTLGNIGKSLGDIGKAASEMVSAIGSEKTKAPGASTDYGGAISAGLQGITKIVNVVRNQIEANKKAQEDWNKAIENSARLMALTRVEAFAYKEANIFGVENPYAQAIAGAKEYGQATIELAAQTSRLQNEGMVQTGTTKKVSGKNVGEAAGAGLVAGAVIGSIVGPAGTAVGAVIGAGIGALVGGIAGLLSRKTVPVMENLTKVYGKILEGGKLNPKLLADYDKLDTKTKALVDGWQELKKKQDEAQKAMEDNFKALAGDLGKSLSDSLVEAFSNGKLNSAIDAFSAKINEVIKNIVAQLIFDQMFGDLFTQLQDSMTTSFAAGGDNNIVDDIEKFDKDYKTRLDAYNKAMQDANTEMQRDGYAGFTGSTQTRTGASKGLESISQDTAVELNGRFTAIQEHTFEMADGVKKLYSNSNQMLSIALGIKDDTKRLAAIEGTLSKVQSGLDLINTKGITIRP